MKKQGENGISFSLPFCYCRWGVSAPLSQDRPSTALSQLSGMCLPRDATQLLCLQQRQDPRGAVQAPKEGAGTGSDFPNPTPAEPSQLAGAPGEHHYTHGSSGSHVQ